MKLRQFVAIVAFHHAEYNGITFGRSRVYEAKDEMAAVNEGDKLLRNRYPTEMKNDNEHSIFVLEMAPLMKEYNRRNNRAAKTGEDDSPIAKTLTQKDIRDIFMSCFKEGDNEEATALERCLMDKGIIDEDKWYRKMEAENGW